MITELVLKFLGAVLTFVLGLFPSVPKPAWWQSVADFISSAVGGLNGFANFLPVAAMKYALVFVLLCYTVGLAIRVIRIGASVLTGGGGSAA